MRSAVLAVVMLGACGDNELPQLCPHAAPHRPAPPAFEDVRFVAHAFGSPSGLQQREHYTESREAFDVSYHNGFVAYEIDLLELGDGTVVAAHDQAEAEYGLDRPFSSLTRAEVEGRRWKGQYPVLFAEDVVRIVAEHPDIWLIMDTKCCHEDINRRLVELAPDDSVRDRLVPHVTGFEHADALGTIWPFKEKLYARYWWGGTDDEVVERMTTYGIDNVMMWWDEHPGAEWSPRLQVAMANAGYHVWVHTPEDPATIEEFVAGGVGVYTNGYIDCTN